MLQPCRLPKYFASVSGGGAALCPRLLEVKALRAENAAKEWPATHRPCSIHNGPWIAIHGRGLERIVIHGRAILLRHRFAALIGHGLGFAAAGQEGLGGGEDGLGISYRVERQVQAGIIRAA